MPKFEKFWSGNCSFTAKEIFTDLNTAAQAGLPSAAATYEVDANTLSFDFKRVKEVKTKDVNTDNARDRVRENKSKDGVSTEKKKINPSQNISVKS